MTRIFIGILAATTVISLGRPRAQSAPRVDAGATASIAGSVVRDATTEVVEGVEVTLIDALGAGPNRTTTTASGLFRFDGLRAGRYELRARKPAFVVGAYGADKPERIGRQIVLAPGQRLDNLRVPIFTGAVVAGTLWSPDSRPVPRASVAAARTRYLSGGRITNQTEARSNTDDRGRYRIFGLPPGDYAVAAQPLVVGATSTAALRVVVPIYYPGTDKPDDAARIHLGQGDERLGTDIRLFAVAARSVHVRVRSADGTDLSGMQVRVVASPRDTPPILATGRQWSGTDVVVPDLSPGIYRVSVSASPAPVSSVETAATLRTGEALIDVAASGPLQEVIVLVRHLAVVSGAVNVRSFAMPPRSNLGSTRVWLTPVDAGVGQRRWEAPPGTNSRFLIPNVPAGRYRIDARGIVTGGALQLWTLRSVSRNGQALDGFIIDVGDEDVGSLELTLVDDLAALSGSLLAADGRSTPPHFIVLVARNPDAAGVRQAYYVRPAVDGSFCIAGILDGEYAVAVVEDVHPDDLNNPAILDRFTAAATMTLTFAPGEEKRQDLTISRGISPLM